MNTKITPFLWFDTQAEEVAQFYTSIFPNSKIGAITRYGKEGHEVHGMPAGAVMTIAFELDGQPFTALNGGPHFRFNESVSFVVNCKTQAEVDHYWEKLSAGGDPKAQQCGWLKDRYGLSWQIVLAEMPELMRGPNAGKVMQALLQMKKLDIATLRRAHEQG
jgi:predicted 3-demethylubiquinone-9 3-methyltransferase (glyoxalase superfamily)